MTRGFCPSLDDLWGSGQTFLIFAAVDIDWFASRVRSSDGRASDCLIGVSHVRVMPDPPKLAVKSVSRPGGKFL